MFVDLAVLVILLTVASANELSRCCAGGTRYFREAGNCNAVRSEGSSVTCSRSASICCLRAMLDSSCRSGMDQARQTDSCASIGLNELAGGIKKECCECCMLAKELVDRNEPCVAATGFSPACLNSFNKCCNNQTSPTAGTDTTDRHSAFGYGQENGSRNRGTCADANCEHLCTTQDDGTWTCSCRSGYDLAPDGHSCVDVDECSAYEAPICYDHNTQCMNMEGTFSCVCSPGFYWSNGGSVCVDIDECLLLVDDCLESQRCLNTPGGYKCIRTQSCGTGYAMDSKTEQCVDVDECNLGAHDCGPLYQCKNTQGSFRCVAKKCAPTEIMNPSTGECTSVDCPSGYTPRDGTCEDVDECKDRNRCAAYEECVNTPGSFRCQELGNICSTGYYMDKETGFCLDTDECQRGTHTCPTRSHCINLPGSFKCNCLPGYEFNASSRMCEDIDECVKFAGHSCSLQASCQNTQGSFVCICNTGFSLGSDQRTCEDIDECANGLARCQQKCINSPGSYQCICDRGYQLGIDELTCEDIDECAIWAKSGNELCMGTCVNVPGSFTCTCPLGYEIMSDGITCKDIDECAQPNVCQDDHLCINLLGSSRCQRIECPRNYILDRNYKNRCVKRAGYCENLNLERCKKHAIHISWQHIAIPKQVNISSHRTSVTLFSMKGPNNPNSSMQFELRLVNAKPELPNVTPAIRSNFLLQKGEDHNSALIALRDSLDGPQEIHLELVLRLTTNGAFNGKYIANLLIFVSQYRPQPHHDRNHHLHHYYQHRNRHFTF